jgi:hypothetical protein
MTIADSSGRIYRTLTWSKEADFEECVVKHADQLFGQTSVFLPIKHRVKRGSIVTIPDGYLLDFADPSSPRLFVVEVEIQTHDLFKHITEQLIRFAAAFAQDQIPVRRFIAEAIKQNKEATNRLRVALKKSPYRNEDAFLDATIYQAFRGIVVIDERRDELDAVLKQFASEISALELQVFESAEGKRLYQYETLYDEDQEAVAAPKRQRVLTKKQIADMRQRRALCDTIVVPARKEGYDRVFLGENKWRAIRVSAGMRDRIKYIAGYQVAPVSAVTHIAEVAQILPYGTDGKFEFIFKGPAQKLRKPIKVKNGRYAPYGPIYVQRSKLLKAKHLEDAL